MTGKLKLKVFESKEEALKKAGEDISECIKKNTDESILLLLSGGSALGILSHLGVGLPSDLMVAVLDERYDETDKNNNFFQLQETDFYKKAKEAGASFIDTKVNGRSQEKLAEDFERELRKWKREHKNGKMVATAGVGPDGHTAGMMPFPVDEETFKKLFESENWVAAYDAGQKNPFPKRVTTTNTFLRQIDEVFVFISGGEKKEAFEKMQKEGSLAEVPARILKEIKGTIYTDII